MPLREVIHAAVRLLEPSAVATGILELDRRYREALAELEAARAMWSDGPPLRTAALLVAGVPSAASSGCAAGPDRVEHAVVDGWQPVLGGGVLGGPIRPLLEEAPSDVAVLVHREELGVVFDRSRPVIVPFGGAEHDWATLELGHLDRVLDRDPLRLLGAESAASGQPEDDPTRLPANRSVVLQQLTGVSAETRLVERRRRRAAARRRRRLAPRSRLFVNDGGLRDWATYGVRSWIMPVCPMCYSCAEGHQPGHSLPAAITLSSGGLLMERSRGLRRELMSTQKRSI